MIDRISPTRRPNRSVAGYHQWRSLLFMHWPVPIKVLRPLVPAGLEIDTYEGVAYVGLVPFSMLGVRPHWAPKFSGFSFLETNVRTYVTYNGQPGVHFISLDAASLIGVWTARILWGLPYYHAKMSLEVGADTVHYQSTRKGSVAKHNSRCQLGEPLGNLAPESIEFFFLERYLLFLERRQQIYCGQVYHTPYPVQHAEVVGLDDGLLAASGIECCQGMPAYAHYSSGVDVEIFGLRAV